MDKAKMISLIAKLIQTASENGDNYNWMYDEPGNPLDQLCEALDISFEEIQDIVGGFEQ